MNRCELVLLLVLVASSTSCSKYEEARDFQDYSKHYLRAQDDYCSTNILVAEKGLVDFRQWISNRDLAGNPRFNFHLNLVQVNARLCSVYEALGEADKAQGAYKQSAEAYDDYLRSQHLPAHSLSRQEMLERLGRQEERLHVGWKEQKGKISTGPDVNSAAPTSR